jgi:hypothetical protein
VIAATAARAAASDTPGAWRAKTTRSVSWVPLPSYSARATIGLLNATESKIPCTVSVWFVPSSKLTWTVSPTCSPWSCCSGKMIPSAVR